MNPQLHIVPSVLSRLVQVRQSIALGPIVLSASMLVCLTSVHFAAFAQESGNAVEPNKPTAEQLQFFEAKIRPVLIEHCYRCHSADGQGIRGGLGVDNRDALVAGGESGPAIVPGNLEESLLWNAINYQDYRMPPKGKLPDSVIADFKTWIEMGAPDPRSNDGVVIHSKVTEADIEEGKKFWAFTRPTVVPAIANQYDSWAKTEIDRYVAAAWAKNEIQHAEDCEPETLVRRLTLDLVGLPPTREEREGFLARWKSDSDAAVSDLVDKLLNSPQFGERWGRHWLDVARYAETSGKETDVTFPNAWRYRDYVIRSFNEDKPYDRFITEQIAGDLLPAKNDQQWTENLIATGFLAIGPKSLSEQNPRQFQADLIDEQIDTTSRVVLGLSVGCARCHDHKFDPIPQSDYYALAGIFYSTETLYGGTRSIRNRHPSDWIRLPVQDAQPIERPIPPDELAALKKELQEKQAELAEARRAQRTGTTAPSNNKGTRPVNPQIQVGVLDQLVSQLNSRINSVDEKGKPISFCMGVQDNDQPRNARVLIRGEIDQPAQEVPRGFVQVLGGNPTKLPGRSSGRKELAQWMVSKDNPLAARVMVNRIWKHLIGKPLVRDPDNFGVSGTPPTHPELLDFMAIEFMNNGWSVKHMIRSIANSRVYRLSSSYDPTRFELDPENHWISRANSKRLDAEAIRDAMLAVSGQLDLKPPKASLIATFGSTVMGPNGPQNLPLLAANTSKPNAPNDSTRANTIRNMMGQGGFRNPNANIFETPNYHRSVYLPVARNALPRALDAFDFAEPSLLVGEREVSNTAEQALYMLNNPFVLELSDALARKVMKHSKEPRQQMVHAFQLVYGRPPSNDEMKAANRFYRQSNETRSSGKKDEAAFRWLSQFCQALFGSAEFRIVN
ncbi:MAG: PSD1 and planctomycete cytochrome C domain-containing protein [Pirellula sp.]|jgi:cytochrome c553